MKDLLDENGCGHIKIFGGGGGTILPAEIEELHAYGITRIYSPDDGRTHGLEGMIEDVLKKAAPKSLLQRRCYGNGNRTGHKSNGNGNGGKFALGEWRDIRKIASSITNAENGDHINILNGQYVQTVNYQLDAAPVLGITGTGGAGKSSVTDEIVRRFLNTYT